MEPLYYRYWGKARKPGEQGAPYHLLPYHCLDVAAVGQVLLHRHDRLRKYLAQLVGLDAADFTCWAVFFLALHDLGKFADSFQNLKPELLKELQDRNSRRGYAERHDTLGFVLWREHLSTQIEQLIRGEDCGARKRRKDAWFDHWMRAMTGHHGQPPRSTRNYVFDDVFEMPQDIEAAQTFS